MIKKALIIIIMTITSLAAVCALENEDNTPKNGISLGGTASIESFKSGGSFEFGFPLYSKNNLTLRNFIVFSGLGTTGAENAGIFMLNDKISAGGFWNSRFRTYGFIAGGFGFFAANSKKFFEAPFFWEIRGGGGIDIYVSSSYAFFAEFGGGFSSITSDNDKYSEFQLKTGFTNITIGFRNYF